MEDNDEILQKAADWQASGKGVALATVVTTWGSSPRPVGSKLVVDQDEQFPGLGLGRLRRGRGHRRGPEIDQGRQAAPPRFRRHQRAGLGGRASPAAARSRSSSSASNEARTPASARSPRAATAAPPRSPPTSRPASRASVEKAPHQGDIALDDALKEGVQQRSCRRQEPDGRDRRPARSSSRCSIRGCAASSSAPCTSRSPWRAWRRSPAIIVTVVDPRTAFATDERFPGIERLDRMAGRGAREAEARSAHRDRDPDARSEARRSRRSPWRCSSEAFYIGALGSKRTHAARLAAARRARLQRQRISRASTGPVGLDIGAISPAEIAVSILAQVDARAARRAARQGGRGVKFGETPLAEALGAILAHSAQARRPHAQERPRPHRRRYRGARSRRA